ncbi:MAG: helical backbone metal receptor, partial [Deltaproteobacteria bacterium]|nr:helical backbone metal receptor [Deltaproteobacteria bacterium]
MTAVLFFLLPAGGDGDIVYILNNGRINLKKDIRIVSVAPSVTEILYEIGLGENIVGVTRYDDVPEDVRNKEVVGGYLDIDVEKILRIKPDVVMCEPNSGIRDSVDILSRNGIPVIVVDIRSVMNILDAVERIGELLDRKM